MYGQRLWAKRAAIISALAAAVVGAGQSQPTSAPTATEPALDPLVDQILTRLENRQVHDLRAEVSWKLQYVIDLDSEATTKKGTIWYQQHDPVARFLVHFREKIVSNRLHKLDERYLFDGRWFTELNSETKTITRREVRRAGDTGNPYRLGEGPFPVPFGQSKADILKEFAVALVPPAADDPPRTDHLKLTPRPDSQTGRNYQTVDVWIAREGPEHGLPVKVHSAKKDGTGSVNSFITITFQDAQLNRGFSGSVFEIKTPSGYHEEVETLDSVAPPASAPTAP